MGKNKSRSVLGDYSGKVGTVVLYNYRGTPVMKPLPAPSQEPASGKQLEQRAIFSMVKTLLTSLKKVIHTGFQVPRKSRKAPFDMAMSYHMKNCILHLAEGPSFQLEKLKLSNPVKRLQSVWKPVASVAENNTLILNWELNPYPQKDVQLSDKVYIVVYDATINRFSTFSCRRSDLGFSYSFIKEFAGHELYSYLFLTSADAKLVSETEYLGKVNLTLS
jgi:hypothetical protein